MRGSGARLPARRISLDTSAYSWFRSGHPVVADWICRAERVDLSATVVGELEGGFRLGSRYRQNRFLLDEFLEEPFVTFLDVTAETAGRYGQIFGQLRRAGTPIPTNDIWIGASVLLASSHLVTFDTDFSKIEGLPHSILTPV